MNNRLKQLRKQLGLTQTDFGSKLGVTGTQISFLESGKSRITNQILIAVCKVFGVRREWLEKGEGSMYDLTILTFEKIKDDFAIEGYTAKIIELYLQQEENTKQIIERFLKDFVEQNQ